MFPISIDVPRPRTRRAEPSSDAGVRVPRRLSPREAEVARLAAAGETNARVARTLGVSPHTVRHHLEAVYAKLDVHSRAELVARLATIDVSVGGADTR